MGQCEDFDDQVVIPKHVEAVTVTCRTGKPHKPSKAKVRLTKRSSGVFYENVHAVLNPEKVRDRLQQLNATSEFRGINNSTTSSGATATSKRPLSVLMLGIDSVSRLDFHRTMPLTRDFFEERGWLELRGYNKMGDNTFPNLMAFLTGQNQSWAYSKCTPKVAYGLDNCSMIWYNYRDAGYVTAYGEDHASISTFNYLKVGYFCGRYSLGGDTLLAGWISSAVVVLTIFQRLVCFGLFLNLFLLENRSAVRI